MSEDDRKLVWPWIVAAAIILPVVYVAAFGPACCLYWSHNPHPRWIEIWINAPDPMDWIIESLPKTESDRLYSLYYLGYLDWWAEIGKAFARS